MKYMQLFRSVVLILCFLVGCGRQGEGLAQSAPYVSGQVRETASTPEPLSGERYEAPEMLLSEFHDVEAVDGVQMDLSSLSEGYVAVAAVSECRLKFQVKKDEQTYNYNIASDGTPSIFPLQCGDGVYTFRVMENVTGTKYAVKCAQSAEVKLRNEFLPYLRPSDYVPYDEASRCVREAEKLAGQCQTALEVVGAVFDYICANVTYDKEKAATVQSGYMPDPDETLDSGKGICFDYAALAAAMLRSQGIPTRMIFGNVSPDDLYHAWNMFYTEESGWITVDYQVSRDSWNRLDLTFSANGTDGEFIGNGKNYTDIYIY